MDTIAELRLPAEDFALQHTLTVVPTATFEAERITAHDTDRVLPLLWVAGEGLDNIGSALDDDPSVDNVELLTDLDSEQLYRMEWVKNTRFVVHMLIEENAAILSASGTASGWRFRALFPDRDALSTTYEFCQTWDLDLSIESVYEMNGERYGRFGLTKDQSEALVLALSQGYYELPRESDMTDIAKQLGISPQAVSERLRRAHKQLVQESIAIGVTADASRKR